jgi:hypothetical protein
LKTNSPVANALSTLSFIVSLVKASMGGRECTALKKLYGRQVRSSSAIERRDPADGPRDTMALNGS